MEQKRRQRTSFREVAYEVYPRVLKQANKCGLVTIGWSLGTPYGDKLYLRDGEDNLCEGWPTTHDAKVGLQGMECAFRLAAKAITESRFD